MLIDTLNVICKPSLSVLTARLARVVSTVVWCKVQFEELLNIGCILFMVATETPIFDFICSFFVLNARGYFIGKFPRQLPRPSLNGFRGMPFRCT
jgi:hypothetical protein